VEGTGKEAHAVSKHDDSTARQVLRSMRRRSSSVDDPVVEEGELEGVLIEGVDVGGVGVGAFELGKKGEGLLDLQRYNKITKSGMMSRCSSKEGKFRAVKSLLTSRTRACCSGRRVCDAFSEKLLLIISSTRRASTRNKLRIML